MLQFEEQRLRLEGYRDEIADLGDALGIDMATKEIASLEEQSAAAGFWDDLANSQKILQRISQLKSRVADYSALRREYDDALTLIELADEEEDESLLDEVREGVDAVVKRADAMRLTTLLSGEYDSKNAILTFHAGAGGTEAQDWAEMLFRMYNRWAERHGFKAKTLDYLDGEEAGLKSAVDPRRGA